MSTSILRTTDAWWVETPAGAARIATKAKTTAELLADQTAIAAAGSSTDTVPVDSLALVSPVTAPCAARGADGAGGVAVGVARATA